jgi:hypothetical protein
MSPACNRSHFVIAKLGLTEHHLGEMVGATDCKPDPEQ